MKLKCNRRHLQCLTHNEFDTCIRIKHTIQNPDFFDINPIFNEYLTNHDN